MYHFIYPSKDSYIYEVNTNSEKNFGGDGNLVLKKDFDVNSLKGVSRVLLNFDLSELSQSIVSNTIPTDAKYFLRLYEQKTSELSPEYSLATFPLSSSWEDGTGYTTQDPNSRNGVSWVRSDESFDNTTWVKNSGPYDSGSRSVAGGGIWVTGSAEWSGSQEDSSDYSGDINFFSSNADSIYSPKIEVRWDSHTTIGDTGLTQLTIDGTKDNYLYMMNLRDTYKETEKPRFRVGARERYQTKSASTTKSTTSPMYVPEGSGSYSIIDVETGTTIVPFGDYSLFSSDSVSNYFKQDLRGFINNRSYRIVLRLKTDDNKLRIFDDNFNFKVVS